MNPSDNDPLASIPIFFLFVNTKSGSNFGKTYISEKTSHLKFQFSIGEVLVHIYDMFKPQHRQNGFKLCKKMSENNDYDVRVIVCGGDGTIPWIMNNIIEHEISFKKIVFGVIPIGTGNDFSRNIGWGFKPIKFSENNYSELGKQVYRWINSTVAFYDMWDVKVQTYENGKIYFTSSKVEVQHSDKQLKRMFSNYTSIGIDAKVVYRAEMWRTNYACLTKALYGLIGLINQLRPYKKMEQTMENLTQYQVQLKQKSSQNLDDSFLSTQTSKLLDEDKQKQLTIQETYNENIYKLKGSYRNLVCLNATSYMTGLNKIWTTKKVALKEKSLYPFKKQKNNDGMVQFVTYKNQLSLALERVCRSGSKVTQGGGPFEINMKVPPKNKQQVTFMQIDGESIKIENLKRIYIKKTDVIQDHRIRVMVNEDSQA